MTNEEKARYEELDAKDCLIDCEDIIDYYSLRCEILEERLEELEKECDILQELVDKENCNIEEVGSWGYFGGCRHITDDVKFAYLRGEIELTNEQKFWFLGQLINKSKNKLSTSHNLICNMRGMGGTDKSVLKKILGVED